jgi:hypothetical protein
LTLASADKKIRAQNVRARQREEEALALRRAGHGYAEIGRRIGISRQGARALVIKAYEALSEDMKEETAKARDVEIDRNDAILAAWWDLAQQGDEKAANVVLKALAQRHKILGLESQTVKSQVSISGADEWAPVFEVIHHNTDEGEG